VVSLSVGIVIHFDCMQNVSTFDSFCCCCVVQGIQAGLDKSSASSDTGSRRATACPASLRFKEPTRLEATIVPACRARRGHRHTTLYTSTHSQLTIGQYRPLFCILLPCTVSLLSNKDGHNSQRFIHLVLLRQGLLESLTLLSVV